AATGSISPFADVSFRHPSAGYIRAASQAGYLSAYADGNFRPGEAVDGATAVRAVLALLGYGRGQYGMDHWQFAVSLGLLDDLNISGASNISQIQANRLFYNALTVANVSGKSQLELLGFTLSNGAIDLQSIISATASGPITILNANWYTASGLKTDTLTVYRNNALSKLSALQTYDVVYYNANMNMVWAFSDKVSGIFKAAGPSRLSPATINISGMEYNLSTSASAKLGAADFEYGETLILLLGSNDMVADILRQSELAFDVTGFVIAADKFMGRESDGSEYSGYTITLITVDGSVLTYEVRRNYSNTVGRLVKLSYSNGEIGLIIRLATNLSGKFEAETRMLGNTKLAEDISILEVYSNGAYDNVYLPRLDGMYISEGKVLHYVKNADGAISAMFLFGATGDLLQYGIITAVSEDRSYVSSGGSGGGSDGGGESYRELRMSGTYSYILNGKSGSISINGSLLHAEKGPAALTFKSGQLSSVKALTALRNTTLFSTGFVLDKDNNRYLMSGNASIYQLINGEYKLLSIKQAQELNRTFTAYYDKPEKDGGRIRLLIAE
ncbi:MAG: S-layer homology domain-containing protein, partial [Clostridiales bacterium]|nr:S-layer homology domain-containing protein [Clostridiales bacterium]